MAAAAWQASQRESAIEVPPSTLVSSGCAVQTSFSDHVMHGSSQPGLQRDFAAGGHLGGQARHFLHLRGHFVEETSWGSHGMSFGAFALLDGPGLTQFRGLGFKGLRV